MYPSLDPEEVLKSLYAKRSELEREAKRLWESGSLANPYEHPPLKKINTEIESLEKKQGENLKNMNDVLQAESKDEDLLFDEKESVLHFKGKEIGIKENQESYPHELLQTIFKDPQKTWNNDEILDDWYGTADEGPVERERAEALERKRIYHAGKNINQKVAIKTGVDDFLEVTTKDIKINEKYLSS